MKKSILASILIGFGAAVLLILGNPLGPVLFAFGLLGVCYLDAWLFTGKTGYYWKNQKTELATILVINLISGWAFGYLLSIANPNLVTVAMEKVAGWEWGLPHFIQSFACGMIMYICVELFKRGSVMGIFYGVPLFIFCGFQHCIANAIYLGVANTFDSVLLLCIFGNFCGGVIANILSEA